MPVAPYAAHFDLGTIPGMGFSCPFGAPVVGVSHYQTAVVGVAVGDRVVVRRQPDNPVDPNAFVVETVGDGRRDGETLGYLPAFLAARVVNEGLGDRFDARIEKVLAGHLTTGLRLWIEGPAVQPEPVPDAALDDDDAAVVESEPVVRVLARTGRMLGTFAGVDDGTGQVLAVTATGVVRYPKTLVRLDYPDTEPSEPAA